MITVEQMERLVDVIGAAAEQGRGAMALWGHAQQRLKAIEEAGELATALARYPSRASNADILSEAADVIITALQVGMIHGSGMGLDDLIDAIEMKTTRLAAQIRGRTGG